MTRIKSAAKFHCVRFSEMTSDEVYPELLDLLEEFKLIGIKE